MNNLGFGVMINILADSRESDAQAIQRAVGKTIANIVIEKEEKLILTFRDGSKLVFYDGGQSCCEHRWMHTDDDLSVFEHAEFMSAEVADGPEEYGEWDEVRESQFLKVTTTLGTFTVVNYNDHNGYYGGFWLKAYEVGAEGRVLH